MSAQGEEPLNFTDVQIVVMSNSYLQEHLRRVNFYEEA